MCRDEQQEVRTLCQMISSFFHHQSRNNKAVHERVSQEQHKTSPLADGNKLQQNESLSSRALQSQTEIKLLPSRERHKDSAEK